MTVTPIDLFASCLRLDQGGTIHAGKGPADRDQDGRRLRAFHARTGDDVHADHWEVHPEAEEVVSMAVTPPRGSRLEKREG